MLAITVSSAIMGFELPEQGLGAWGGAQCVHTEEAQGHDLGCDVKRESEQGVTEVASGKTVSPKRVCHS